MDGNDNTDNLLSHDALTLPVRPETSIVRKIQIMIGVGFALILLINIFFIVAPVTVEFEGRRVFTVGARTFYAVVSPGVIFTQNSDSLATLFCASRRLIFAFIQPTADTREPTVLASIEDGGGITTLDSLATLLSMIESTHIVYTNIHEGVLDLVIRRTIDTTMLSEASSFSDSLTCERYWPSYPYFLHLQATLTDTAQIQSVFEHMNFVVQVNRTTK